MNKHLKMYPNLLIMVKFSRFGNKWYLSKYINNIQNLNDFWRICCFQYNSQDLVKQNSAVHALIIFKETVVLKIDEEKTNPWIKSRMGCILILILLNNYYAAKNVNVIRKSS